jgi:hypothetical protein
VAFVTRKDFSFLRSIPMWGGVCALVLITDLPRQRFTPGGKSADRSGVADEPVKRFLVEIDLMIRARYPAIYVVTWEEGRLESLLYELGCQQGKPLQIWTAVCRAAARA